MKNEGWKTRRWEVQKRKIEGGVAAITGRREGKAKERRRKGEDEVTREGRKRLRGIRMDEPPAAEGRGRRLAGPTFPPHGGANEMRKKLKRQPPAGEGEVGGPGRSRPTGEWGAGIRVNRGGAKVAEGRGEEDGELEGVWIISGRVFRPNFPRRCLDPASGGGIGSARFSV